MAGCVCGGLGCAGVAGDVALKGLIPRCFEHVFEAVAAESGSKKFLVRASYLEVYNEVSVLQHALGQNPLQPQARTG